MMSSSSSSTKEPPHIVFFLCPGLGHVTPLLRLAAMAASRNCTVTLIDTLPSVSAEDAAQIAIFLSGHPEINCREFNIGQINNNSTVHDAFMNQYDAITSSLHLLPPILLSCFPQPVSAIFSEFAVANSLTPFIAKLGIPNYIVSATSARSYSTVAFLPFLSETAAKRGSDTNDIIIPGLAPLPRSYIHPSWWEDSMSNPILQDYLIPNARSLPKVNGVIVNSFDWLETETIEAFNEGKVLSDLPKIFPLGPLEPHKLERDLLRLPWLDEKPAEFVVFVSFGNRLNLSKDQIRELGNGLKKSGYSFLWDLGANSKAEIQELLGEVKDNGMIMKFCENRAAVLAHPAIGGFINLCEWDALSDAAREGVPILAWPLYGTQRMNAEVVVNAGLGILVKEWEWARLIEEEAIGESVRELMGNEAFRFKAKKVGEEARKACERGGSSEKVLTEVIEMLNKYG